GAAPVPRRGRRLGGPRHPDRSGEDALRRHQRRGVPGARLQPGGAADDGARRRVFDARIGPRAKLRAAALRRQGGLERGRRLSAQGRLDVPGRGGAPGDVFSMPGSDLAQSYERLLFGDKAASSVEGVYRRKDGSTFPVEAVRRVVPSATGDIIVAIARDISPRKLAEEGAKSQSLQQMVIAEFAQQALGNPDLEQVMSNAAEIV